jgi:hypothetical protein
MCVPLSLSLARAVLCLYVSTTGPVIIVIICIEFDELVIQTHSFGDCIRPNLGEFDGGKSKFSLNRRSTNFATKRSHFTKCILFRKRDCHHECEFNHSTKGSPLRYARRRGRCESLSNWSIYKCKINSDCAFVQNLTLCVCARACIGNGKGTNLGLIIGLSVGGFVFFIGGLVFFCRRVKRVPTSPDYEPVVVSLAVAGDTVRHRFQPDANVDVSFITDTEPSRPPFNRVIVMDHDNRVASRDRELPLRSAYLDDDLMMRMLLEQEGNDGRSLVHLDSYDSHDQLEKDALPTGWMTSKDQDGSLYYYNKELKVTQWNHPGESVEQTPPNRHERSNYPKRYVQYEI